MTLASPNLSFPVLLICFFSMLLFSEVLFKPANFKAVRVSTTEDHQGVAFSFFEGTRGLLAFVISLLWTAMLAAGADAKTIMLTSFSPDAVPADIVSPAVFWTLIVLMLCASACCFMIRGVYYAPIGEFGVPAKHSSAAMSFAITLGYIPALLATAAVSLKMESPGPLDRTRAELKGYIQQRYPERPVERIL
ncbi:MAG: hypothetical protein LBR21_05660 [Propionibacteriaceae bacterium]|jgi:hypothetical protein|nr:hypothetical protein [Propionibacteriaceae bacterium]